MALRVLDLRGSPPPYDEALPRPDAPGADVHDAVARILREVRADGDAAVIRSTAAFDGVDVSAGLRVSPADVKEAQERVDPDLRSALQVAFDRIVAYHAHEGSPPGEHEHDGIVVNNLTRPVGRAGIYAPGGRARYPSTVLMCAAPARVAGVGTIALCVPPGADGKVDDATLCAAGVAGVDEVYRIGGAQAIGALAYGTESVPAVDVVAGPGATPEFAAIDLVVQAEHGPDGLAWLVTWDAGLLDAVAAELDRIVAASPRRADLEATLATAGISCLVDGPTEALAVANTVAPEHLQLMVPEPDAADLLEQVQNAGAVFLGDWSPASIGDYIAGPNHVLPTNRTARFASALRADDFRKHVHAVRVSPGALRAFGPKVVLLAETEGLPAHAESVRRRLDALDREGREGS